MLRMAQRKRKDTKQQPCTAGPGNMLGCCLMFFPFPVGPPEHEHCMLFPLIHLPNSIHDSAISEVQSCVVSRYTIYSVYQSVFVRFRIKITDSLCSATPQGTKDAERPIMREQV